MRTVLAASALSTLALGIWGCADTGPGGIVTNRKDQGTVADMSVTGDAGPTGDLARAWKDVTYTGGVGVHAVPDGGSLWSVWNDTAGTVLAVGDYATILRSQNGGAFTADTSIRPTPTPAFLSVYGEGPNGPVYIDGQNDAMWAYTGSLTTAGTWTADEPGVTNYLYGVWVAPDGAAFAAGDGVMLIRKMDGTYNWTPLTGGPIAGEAAYSIWGVQTGTGTYSIYAAGCKTGTTTCDMGMIWHSTGGAYTTESLPTTQAMYGIWGASATDIYAVGDKGSIFHSTGDGTWTAQSSGVTVPLEGIGGSGPDEIYVVGDPDFTTSRSTVLHKYDHTSNTWSPETPLASATDNHYYFGVSATTKDVYLVGDSGAILHK